MDEAVRQRVEAIYKDDSPSDWGAPEAGGGGREGVIRCNDTPCVQQQVRQHQHILAAKNDLSHTRRREGTHALLSDGWGRRNRGQARAHERAKHLSSGRSGAIGRLRHHLCPNEVRVLRKGKGRGGIRGATSRHTFSETQAQTGYNGRRGSSLG